MSSGVTSMLRLNDIVIDPVNRSISHNGKTVYFSPHGKKRLGGRNLKFDLACRLIIGPPAGSSELFDDLYGDYPDGGPMEGAKVIVVMLQRLIKDLENIDIVLVKELRGLPRTACQNGSNKTYKFMPKASVSLANSGN